MAENEVIETLNEGPDIFSHIRSKVGSLLDSAHEGISGVLSASSESVNGSQHATLLDKFMANYQDKDQPFMKAAFITKFADCARENLVVETETIKKPKFNPNSDQLVIQVLSCSLNPFDVQIMKGNLQSMYPVSFPFVPGHDISGQVVAAGAQCTEFREGDLVWGVLPAGKGGGLAEYVVLPETHAWRKPECLGFEGAAALGSAALAAHRVLADEAEVFDGAAVLLLGGHRAAGAYAVQLLAAGAFGANVTLAVVARPGAQGLLRHLGAGQSGPLLPRGLEQELGRRRRRSASAASASAAAGNGAAAVADGEGGEWWVQLREEMHTHYRKQPGAHEKGHPRHHDHHFDVVVDCDGHPENWARVEPFLAPGAQFLCCDPGAEHRGEPVGYRHLAGARLFQLGLCFGALVDRRRPTWRPVDPQEGLVPAPMRMYKLSKMVKAGTLAPVIDTSDGVYKWETIQKMFQKQESGKVSGKLVFQVRPAGKALHLHGNQRHSRREALRASVHARRASLSAAADPSSGTP